MTIEIKNLRRPGSILDSSKLAILANKITGDISSRTNGLYIAKSKISSNKMKITVFMKNETGKYSAPFKDEQEMLAGKISNFLNENGISHDIKVV